MLSKIKKSNFKVEKGRSRTLIYFRYYKKQIFDHYGWKCNCCGETTPQFLTIDHVENDGYKDKNKNGKRLSGMNLYLRIFKENFSSRYQILCMNCNHGKNMNNGICPHQSI